jgi:hypothetical protein
MHILNPGRISGIDDKGKHSDAAVTVTGVK